MKIHVILLLLLIPYVMVSQNKGTITFTETVKFNLDVPEGMEDMFAKVPKQRSSNKVLYYHGDQSLYKNIYSDEEDEDMSFSSDEGSMQIEFKVAEPDNQVYCDHHDGLRIMKQDFLGKNFLVEGEIEIYPWKIGTERRKILDYVCMNATAEVDTATRIMAWFTTDIPASMGPAEYHGLPGMILAVELNENERITVATDISFEAPEDGIIAPPTKGKKVSHDEFEKIRDEKLKEMNAQRGGRNVHIITRTIE
jgi:GLPGLI family protein